MTGKLHSAEEALRLYARSLPEAVETRPWDRNAVKFRNKTFVFFGGDQNASGLSATVRPHSAEIALLLPYVEQSGYGLGVSGWVTARPGPKDKLDLA